MIPVRSLPSKIFVLSLSCSFALVSCAESQTVQCQKIMQVTRQIANQSMESRQTKDEEKVLTMAANFDKAAIAMGKLSIADTQLANYQNRYGEIYRSNAETTRKFIDAIQQKDIVTARLMQKQVQEIGDRERTLGAELNNYCQVK